VGRVSIDGALTLQRLQPTDVVRCCTLVEIRPFSSAMTVDHFQPCAAAGRRGHRLGLSHCRHPGVHPQRPRFRAVASVVPVPPPLGGANVGDVGGHVLRQLPDDRRGRLPLPFAIADLRSTLFFAVVAGATTSTFRPQATFACLAAVCFAATAFSWSHQLSAAPNIGRSA
jgi:hypothetical protein